MKPYLLLFFGLLIFSTNVQASSPSCLLRIEGQDRSKYLENECFYSEDEWAVGALEYLYSYNAGQKDSHVIAVRNIFASENAYQKFQDNDFFKAVGKSENRIVVKTPSLPVILEKSQSNKSYSKARAVVPVYFISAKINATPKRPKRVLMQAIRITFSGERSENKRSITDTLREYKLQYDYKIDDFEVLGREEYVKIYTDDALKIRDVYYTPFWHKLQFWKN